MEASVPSPLLPPTGEDLRELAAPVAAWLATAGFQEVGCTPTGGDSTTVDARWEGGKQVFRLLLHAMRTDARCHLWSRERGMCFTWMRVQSLAQVQGLLSQSLAFQQAQQARAAPPAAPARPAPAQPPNPG